MENFNLDGLMDLAEAYVGPMIDAIYRRLMDRDFALEDPEVVMLLTALINILGHDNRGDRPTELLLMAAYRERGLPDRPNMRVMRWRNGTLSGSDLAKEPGLGISRTYRPGEMPMPSKPKPWADENASGDEQRGCLVWFTTESSCATKEGESRTEGSDEPNHARSGWDKGRTGKNEKGAERGDKDHAHCRGRQRHVEEIVRRL